MTSRDLTMSASLNPPLRKQIERRRQRTRDYRLAMRLSTLLWRDDGKTETEIAHLLGICTRTVRHWLR
jgi:predicted transcriptional regulator